jgi:hypothetical protein
MSQDAKFFQRGKIQVRVVMRAIHLKLMKLPGVPPGAPGRRDEGQKVHEAEDYFEEDSGEHYYGK